MCLWYYWLALASRAVIAVHYDQITAVTAKTVVLLVTVQQYTATTVILLQELQQYTV